MAFAVALLLVVAIHLSRNITAWTGVGLHSDDRNIIGVAILRHRGAWSFDSMFLAKVPPGAPVAIYRPFAELSYWCEVPWFGTDPLGYHVVNSVLHCGTALLWYALVRRLSGSLAAGLAAAVLFAGWPGHGEATHWISCRMSLLGALFSSGALLALDVALTEARGWRRAALLGFGAACAVPALGGHELAVLVLAVAPVIAWHRIDGPARTRMLPALRALTPLAIATIGFLWWRATRMNTWTSGSEYGWTRHRVGLDTLADWLALLMAPVHTTYTSSSWRPLLWLLHGSLLLAALTLLRSRPARAVLALGGLLALLGVAAGVGMAGTDPQTLQNGRYAYEPALGLCAMLGLGVAALPAHFRGPALALCVLAHAVVLDGNRQNWLRAGDVYRRMEHEIVALAQTSRRPVRVVDAPGVYEGAFVLLNGFTEFAFMKEFAPPGTDLRGSVSSAIEWSGVLRELADAAAAGKEIDNLHTVAWNDGALLPLPIDHQWPQRPWPETAIGYARLARQRPFAGTTVPVQVFVQTSVPCTLTARCRVAEHEFASEPRSVAPQPTMQPIELLVPLTDAALPGVAVAFELVVRGAAGERVYGLGASVVASH